METPLSQQILIDILSVGVRAISTYNMQPWRFRLREDGVDIFYQETAGFLLAEMGVEYLEIGAVIENLVEGAAHYGFEAEVQILSEKMGLEAPCASLQFKPSPKPRKDIQFVLERRTNRNVYADTPVSGMVQKELAALNDDKNIQIAFWSGHEKHKLADVLTVLELIRLKNFHLMKEAMAYMRISEEESDQHRDHLDARALSIYSSSIRMVKKIMVKYPLFVARTFYHFLKSTGHYEAMAAEHVKLLRKNGTMFVFMIKDRDYLSYIRLGRVVQRILNDLARRGLASMPLISGFCLLDLLKTHKNIFSKKQREQIEKAGHDLDLLFDLSNQKIAFVIRAGIAELAPPLTARRDLQSFLLEKK